MANWPSTPIHGKLARISYGSTVIDYSSQWTINVAREVAIVQRQGQQWKDAVAGVDNWSGSANFVFVKTSQQSSVQQLVVSTVALAASVVTKSSEFKFCFDSTEHFLTGEINITGMTFDAPVGDVIRCNMTFQGTGSIEFSS